MEFKNDIVDTEELEQYEEFVPMPIGVYVKRDRTGKIEQINSEIFIEDLSGWEKIDEGFGDKYAHAQTHYKIKTDSI